MKKEYKRSGDHSFHEIDKMPKGEVVKHNGSFIFGVGEASNHNHVISVERPSDMVVVKTDDGECYFRLLSDGLLTHVEGNSHKTADHKPITIKKGMYIHVHEREVDIFSNVVRKVID